MNYYSAKASRYSANVLAGMVDLSSPLGGEDSPGAQFLLDVKVAFGEALGYARFAAGQDRSDTGEYRGDVISEIADAAPDPGEYMMWQEFTGLGAFRAANDEISEHINQAVDGIANPPRPWEGKPEMPGAQLMEDAARWALYTIAGQLLHALCRELDEYGDGME